MLVGVLIAVSVTTAFPTRQQRLSLADWGSYSFRDHKGPGTYAFGYDVEDPVTNNVQFRQEERHVNGTVTGSYGYVDPNGDVRITHYIADHLGYRVSEGKAPPVNNHPLPPVAENPQQVFEGEFFPTFVEEDATNNLDSNSHILFPPSPSKQLTPPFYENENVNYFSNDYDAALALRPSQKLKKSQPQNQLRVGFVQTSKFGRRGPQLLVYENPNGVYGGYVNFRINS